MLKRLRLSDEGDDVQKRLIVVLEDCSLEVAKVANSYQLLSSDLHARYLQSKKEDPSLYRPDIVHQCLLMLLDSPLNRAGLLQIFIHTTDNILIEVNPQTRIPRTFRRFCGLMVQLLHELSIRALGGSSKLFKVIKNPVTAHFPPGCRKIATSLNAKKFISCKQLAESANNSTIVVAVGGFARGKLELDYTEDDAKLSNYPLSAALTCAKLTTGFEEVWNVEHL